MSKTQNTAVVLLATAWGAKHGGINSFSMNLGTALLSLSSDIDFYYVCKNASDKEKADAERAGVDIIDLNVQSSEKDSNWAAKVILSLPNLEDYKLVWWIGHDVITGPVALECKSLTGGQCAIIMHMNYDSYAYVKHKEVNSMEVADKIELQKKIFNTADKCIAVGPLLLKRLNEITDNPELNTCLIPGLPQLDNDVKINDRISAITFGRFENSERLVKQGPLAISAFASSVKIGSDYSLKTMKQASIKVVGINENEGTEMRELAEGLAGRVVNLQALPFIEEQEMLQSLLGDSNLCLMLSWHEGFGLAAWEAIGFGIPIILTKNSGVFNLLDELGGAARGNILAVDIKGSSDGTSNQKDIEEVSKLITTVAADLPRALGSASSLRNYLLGKGYTWTNCSSGLLRHIGLDIKETYVSKFREPYGDQGNQILIGLSNSESNSLLKAAKNFCGMGKYNESLKIIEEIKRNKSFMASYEIAMDLALLEALIHLRKNSYDLAEELVNDISKTANHKNDNIRFVSAKHIENIILRDQGAYDVATKEAKTFIEVSKSTKNNLLIEKSYRKYARTLALGGNWEEALEMAKRACEMAKSRGYNQGECKSLLAMGEAYRHGLDFMRALDFYEQSRDCASEEGNTDCYLWAVLGIVDSLFLLNENPTKEINQVFNFIDSSSNEYFLEGLHFKLCKFSVGVKFNGITDVPIELIAEYEKIGINWPRYYVNTILEGDFSKPKKF